MLVLARKEEEAVHLYLKTEHGEKLLGQVKVVDVKGDVVRLGFEFGREVAIVRDDAKKQEQSA